MTKILFFVGCDKVGKSTLFREVLKQTNKFICVDRFTPCQWVYGNLHGKKDTPRIEDLYKVENQIINSGIKAAFIYVTAEEEDIIKRFKEHKETDISIQQIEHVKQKYTEYLLGSLLPIYTVNTSGYSIEECAGQIINLAEEWIV
jgi:hypothetical protein